MNLIDCCFICRRRSDNVGYSPHDRAPIKWVCWECLDITADATSNGVRSKLPKVYHMARKQLDDYERRALEDGGNAGGEYLDELGKTDLAQLAPEEWSRFLALVLTGYADSMREIVSREVPY
jgi:hypothetical protein